MLTLFLAKMRAIRITKRRAILFLMTLAHSLAKVLSRMLGATSWLLRLCNPTRTLYAFPSLLCLLRIYRLSFGAIEQSTLGLSSACSSPSARFSRIEE